MHRTHSSSIRYELKFTSTETGRSAGLTHAETGLTAVNCITLDVSQYTRSQRRRRLKTPQAASGKSFLQVPSPAPS